MLGIRIMQLRNSMGLTQAQLAKRLHISASAQGMYEQGRRVPSIDMLIAMAQVFSVSLDYLITGSEFSPEVEAKVVYHCPCKSRCGCCRLKRHDDGSHEMKKVRSASAVDKADIT